MKQLQGLFLLLFAFPIINIGAQDHKELEMYARRAQVHGRNMDVLKFIKLLEDGDGDQTFVNLNKLKFMWLNKENCELCSEIQKLKKAQMPLERYMVNYYKYFCYKQNPDLHKDIKKFFVQKRCSSAPDFTRTFTHDDTLRGLMTPLRSSYDVYYYDLDIKFNIKEKTISGSNTIYFDLLDPVDKIQIDAHRQLHISSVVMPQYGPLKFERFNDVIFVHLPFGLTKDKYNLTITYDGRPADALMPPWEGGFVWKKTQGKTWAGVTCEHLGASFWWPCKDHPSDEPDSMRTHFSVPDNLEVVSNGNLESVKPQEGHYKKYSWKISYPINTYNVTFYIGDFEYFKTEMSDSFGKQTLEHYVLPKNLKKAKNYYKLEEEVMAFYEHAFGEYPFKKDGFCMVESPYAGMEHQTAIAIGTRYGKEKRYPNVKDDYLIIHEAAHEWWGNSVTAKDMAHAWLQEGFATYAELMFIENKYGHDAYLEETLRKEFGVFNIWPVVGYNDINDNTFIGGDIYDKGALFLHSLRSTIDNDSLFFKIIRTFAERNRYKMVETKDFLNIVNEFTEKDFGPLFEAYLYRTQVPTLEYKYEYRPEEKKVILKYKWTNVPLGFSMPFAMKEVAGDYYKINASTDWGKKEFDTESSLVFVLGNSVANCPKNYTTYHYTKMLLGK